jgi:hypothetical protein
MPIHPISLRSILILSSQLCLGPLSRLLPLDFPTKILYTFLFCFHMLHSLPISSSWTCPFYLYLAKSARHVALRHTVFSTLLSLHPSSVQISSFSTVFSNTLGPYSSLHVRDQISHPYNATGTIIVFYQVMGVFISVYATQVWTDIEKPPSPDLTHATGCKHPR